MESGGREFFAFICLDCRRMEENIKNIAPEVNEEYYDLIELQTKRNNGKTWREKELKKGFSPLCRI